MFNLDVAQNLVNVLKANREKFDMLNWFADEDGYALSMDRAITHSSYCFSTACAAGWIVALYPEKSKELYPLYASKLWPIQYIAANILGIDEYESYKLFLWDLPSIKLLSREDEIIEILEKAIDLKVTKLSEVLYDYGL